MTIPTFGQRPRFNDYFRLPTSGTPQSLPIHQAQLQAPAAANPNLALQNFGNQPTTTLQLPPITQQGPWDPFRTSPNPFPSAPAGNGLLIQNPNLNVIPPNANQNGFAQPQFQQPQFGTPFFQNQQNARPNNNSAWPSQAWARVRDDFIPRLLERPRFRHTWIHGNNGNELGLNEVDITTTLNWPNWMRTSEPLRLTPGFTFLFWDGPDTGVTGFDLPARTYSAFLAADYTSDPRRNAGIETNLTVGVYSDFENISSDSLRITGVAIGWLKVNSYTTAKLGVEYFDRVDLKLLPAVGVFLAPNPDLRLDVYFPRPKLAQRLPNWRNLEAWAYVGGEYGGGSWTIERMGGLEDQVDVNDVRAFVGIEWMGPRRVTGLAEIGYVFEREMIYRSAPMTKLELQDALMVRLGFAF